MLNVQALTLFLTRCHRQRTVVENTILLHEGCPSSHGQLTFMYVSNIYDANDSIFQVMLPLDKALERSLERNPPQKHPVIR